MSAPEQCTHKRFRSSWYTKLIGWGATSFLFFSALMIFRSEWITGAICLIGAFGLSSFEMSGLAADYAKWRQSIVKAAERETDKIGD